MAIKSSAWFAVVVALLFLSQVEATAVVLEHDHQNSESRGWGLSLGDSINESMGRAFEEDTVSRNLGVVRPGGHTPPIRKMATHMNKPAPMAEQSLRSQAAATATAHFSQPQPSPQVTPANPPPVPQTVPQMPQSHTQRQALNRPGQQQQHGTAVLRNGRPVMSHSVFPRMGKGGPQLRCEKPPSGELQYSITNSINVTVGNVADYGVTPQQCPCAYDRADKCHQAAHMCVATSQTFFCSFYMDNVIVSEWGALIDTHTHHVIRFDHSTIGGGADPQYFPMINSIFLKGFEIAIQKHNPHAPGRQEYNLVVPTRTRWDDCFNHLSFQSMPMISLTYSFHHDKWQNITWHASRYTAAMLLLLGVKRENIVVEKQLLAKRLLMPWLPNWNPLQISAHKGIAAKLSVEMTQSLLTMTIPKDQEDSVKHFFVGKGVDPVTNELIPIPRDEINAFLKEVDSKNQRLIVFLARLSDATRSVVNEKELFQWISKGINEEKYRFVFLGATDPYRTIETLHVLWRRYALFLSRARLVIGPHGGGMNNIMWSPPDCDLIEFNEFPDDLVYTDSHGKTPVRSVFMTGFWTKTLTGRYHNVEASMKHPVNFYEGKMRISPRELLDVIATVNNGTMLKPGFKWDQLPEEEHKTWDEQQQKKNLEQTKAINAAKRIQDMQQQQRAGR